MPADYHVHLERGPWTPEWLGHFVDTARGRGLRPIGFGGLHRHAPEDVAMGFDRAAESARRAGLYQVATFSARGRTMVRLE
jgi:hypothetical protein